MKDELSISTLMLKTGRKEQRILRATKNRKLWRNMIAYVLNRKNINQIIFVDL